MTSATVGCENNGQGAAVIKYPHLQSSSKSKLVPSMVPFIGALIPSPRMKGTVSQTLSAFFGLPQDFVAGSSRVGAANADEKRRSTQHALQ